MDAVDGRGQRGCVALELGTDQIVKLGSRTEAEVDSQGVAWSPDGRYLLVLHDMGGRRALRAWDFRGAAGVPEPGRRLPVPGPYVHAARWAPDSRRVAVLTGQEQDLEADWNCTLDVVGLNGSLDAVPIPPHLRVANLDW